MPTFAATGCELFYQDEGSGRPVVFIHGFTVTGRCCTGRARRSRRPEVSVVAGTIPPWTLTLTLSIRPKR
jgi:pimeloyl-ACP methyl ester carboxylesterase